MEALALRRRAEGNFFLLAVDANPTTRYNRIIKRQSETDSVTFSEFMQQEKFEMQNAEKHKQNLKGCLEMADKLILNDHSVEELNADVDKFVSWIYSKI